MDRKLWMVPKNIRSIPPWKLIQILNIFNSASTDREWDSEVKRMLERKNLKRDFGSYDKNPGGDRTYKSQLICLGLIYDDKNGNIQLTKAGRDLVGGHNEPLLILQKILIRMQYPSVYSLGRNVAISPEVQVRPFLFLLRLLSEYEFLNEEEMTVAIVYGHNHGEAYKKVKQKIFLLRQGKSFHEIIDNDNDIWTTRSKNNPIESRIVLAKDITNIFQNYLDSARLIDRFKEDGITVCRLTGMAGRLIRESDTELIETDIDEIKNNSISYQRRFGAWDGKKDTAKITDDTQPVKDPEELIIRNEFIEFLSKGIREPVEYKEFYDGMLKLGLSSDKVDRIMNKLDGQNTSLFEDRFQLISTAGQKYAREFEEAVVRLLRKIGFEAEHTGDLKRPSGSGGYPDAYAVFEQSGYLFDAKASEYYSLPHMDITKACHTYIPNWTELNETHNLPEAKFLALFCYVAGGYKAGSDIKGRLGEIKSKANVETSALIAWEFFKYVQKNDDCSVDDFISKVSSGGLVNLN